MFKKGEFIPKYIRGKMAKKCLYCRAEISQDSVIDFCERCGTGVFGKKMLSAIRMKMEESRERGDLEQGNIA